MTHERIALVHPVGEIHRPKDLLKSIRKREANYGPKGGCRGETWAITDEQADALITAHDERIRAEALREAADRAVAWQVKLCTRDDWHCECCTECNQLRYAILADEPREAEKETTP